MSFSFKKDHKINIEELQSGKLPKLDNINKTSQTIALIASHLRWMLAILIVLLPIPYNTKFGIFEETKTVFPNVGIAILSELLLISLIINCHLVYLALYQMTYRDLRLFIHKANRVGLLSSEITDMLIDLIYSEESFLRKKKKKYQKNIIKEYNELLQNRNINLEVTKLIDDNIKLKKIANEYELIKNETAKEFLKLDHSPFSNKEIN